MTAMLQDETTWVGPNRAGVDLIVEQIYLSTGHNYFGRFGQPPGGHEIVPVPHADAVAGRGLRGDRFFDYKPDYKGQLTLFSSDVFRELCSALGLRNASPGALRRNVIVHGADLNALIGAEFALQGLWLRGVEECRPCSWMDQALAPGAEQWLRGRGGLRCQILTGGWLRKDRTEAR